jgi:uncharacterized protein (TIGR02246 family)
MKSLTRPIALVFVLVLATCALAVADTPNADEAAIRAALESWSAASKAKDAEAFASVYAPDAVLMLEGAPDLRGREAILAGIGGMMQDPNFSLTFEADQVVVAGSGDLAYETGTYGLTMSDPEGKPAPQHGHYVVVWQKQSDGGWKVVLDVPVSDPPEAAATD